MAVVESSNFGVWNVCACVWEWLVTRHSTCVAAIRVFILPQNISAGMSCMYISMAASCFGLHYIK